MILNTEYSQETELRKGREHFLVRRSLYRIFSACFLYPIEERFSFFKNFEFIELVNNVDSCYKEVNSTATLGTGLMRLLVSLEKTTISSLQSIYIQDAGHIISRGGPLSEIQHGRSHVFQQVQVLNNVQGFYNVFVLDMPEEETGRSEHISVMFEFMQFLLQKQTDALENHETRQMTLYLDAQKKFLKEQAGEWMLLFAMLSGKKSKEGFYSELADLTKEFVGLEMKLFGLETGAYKESGGTQKGLAGFPDESFHWPSMD